MTSQQTRSPRFAIALIAALLCFATVAQAGPPLICHAIEIGNAKSLPWTSQSWMRVSKDEQDPAAGVDGYALVKKALALRGTSQNGNDAQMEFAAALITLSGPRDAHREHAQKAIAGAKSDPLLAQNLASRFTGPQTETISEMLAKNVTSN